MRSSRILPEHNARVLIEPMIEFADRHELLSASPHPPEFRPDVLSEVVRAYAAGRSSFGASQSQARDRGLWAALTHAHFFLSCNAWVLQNYAPP
jgi:hypothetical protein